MNNKLETLLSNSKKSRSGSQAHQLEYKNVFSFEEVPDVYEEEDILPHQHHGATVKEALSKMTLNILKDKNFMVSTVKDEVGDEYAVVQEHLSVFLEKILVIADIIICGGDSKATSSSSAELPQPKVRIEREWKKYRIDNLDQTPLTSTAHQANSSGDVEGGSCDFSVVHDRVPIALTLFEAKKTQLNLMDLSKAEARRAIAQGAYQMVGDIQRLTHVIWRVTSYSSLLTNGLAWLHLRSIKKLEGVVWLHSSPISVVQTAGRGKYEVDEAGIDIVVRNILYALDTAKNIFKDITKTLKSKQQTEDIYYGEDYDEDNYKKDDDKDNSQDRKKARKDYPASYRESGPTQSSNQNTARNSSSSSSNVHGYICMPLTEYNVKNLVRI
mmetsp:Transcript_13648/g.18489  ORF Transcript_13648/g.18489 Transcript_13648/m.18489 type:complete len:384 (-) Transcript_13648:208-1359(-)